jgi:hypothetical protein
MDIARRDALKLPGGAVLAAGIAPLLNACSWPERLATYGRDDSVPGLDWVTLTLCGRNHAQKGKGVGFMRICAAIAFAFLLSSSALAQEPAFNDELLDRMVGQWLLQGTIAGAETTHDVAVEWVLGHQYIQIREVSREKDAKGAPAYEAIVYIGWDKPSASYACLWLDNTGGGGLVGQAIAHAKRSGDEMPFLFHGADGSLFHTTFAYDKGGDAWRWIMDAEEGGKLQPFARVVLTRK